MAAIPGYGSGQYGAGEYGGVPQTYKNVASRVGTDFDFALNGVGLKLVPGAKSYDKHAAQTYSFNPKSLFKTGDGASLNASDLYYWQRLEHSKWDGGESYEPWAPDPSDSKKLSHKYSKSFGFDVTDPHKLSVIREAFTTPTYDFVISTDTPVAYWKLADAPAFGGWRPWFWRYRGGGFGDPTFFEQIDNAKQFGTGTATGVTPGYTPGPISFGSSDTATSFDGFTGAITSGVLDFPAGQTPANWSLELWAKPSRTDQSAIMAMIGYNSTANGDTSYQNAIIADSPQNYWEFNEAAGATTAVDAQGNANITLAGNDTTKITFGNAGPFSNDKAITGTQTGGVTCYLSGSNTSVNLSRVSFEAWISLKTLNIGGTIYYTQNLGGVAGGWGVMLSSTAHLLLNVSGTTHDFGYVFPGTGVWHHIVVTNDGTSWYLFVDGVQVGTAWAATASANPNAFQVVGGDASANWATINGSLSDVAIYNYQLNSTQVLSHYNAGTAVFGQGGFAIGLSDGAGNVGTHFSAYLPAVGWVDSGQVLTTAWQHLIITYDGTSVRFYYNGALVSTVAKSYTISKALGYIAARPAATGGLEKFFGGVLGQVATYSTALSAARVLAHYQRGTGAISFHLLQDAGGNVGTYARFVETFSGYLFVNAKNTNVLYSSNGGSSWTNTAIPGGDTTDFTALWGKGDKIYAATANNVYTGDQTGLATFNGGNPALAGVTAGLYYNGQLYVGIGTSLYYVDPATGIKTQLFDTKNFTIVFIEAFQGKIWFGGTNNRWSRLWTWTNNTLPPSAANGVGQQVQEGTVPYGFIIRSSCVYLNLLCLGGTVAGDTTTEGQGAVYYITSSGQFGQLCSLGPLMKDIRGTGLDWGVRSLWGAENRLYMGYSYNTGIARYDFNLGSFSTHLTVPNPSFGVGQPLGLYGAGLGLPVLAVAFYNGKALFGVGVTGDVWQESTKKVVQAQLEESEFLELPFLPKIIDGIEGTHQPLLAGQVIEVEMSFDYGATWQSMGVNQVVGSDSFNFPLTNVHGNHWRSRINVYRGSDNSQSPDIYNWSVRFAPYNSPKHEWVLDAYLPTIQQGAMGAVLTDVGSKLVDQLWQSRENGTVVDYIDMDRRRYKVLVIEIKQMDVNRRPVRGAAGQLQLGPTVQVELLEVNRVS